MIRLVALDIDGTILTSDKKLTDRTLHVIKELGRRHIPLVLVTGRTYPAAIPIARALGIEDLLVVAHNGALVKRLDQKEPIASRLIPAPIARRAIRILTGQDVNLSCSDQPYGQGRVVLDRPPSARLAAYLESVAIEPLIVDSLETFVDHPVIQVSVSGSTAQVEDMARHIQSRLAALVSLSKTTYSERNLTILDILQAGCSKRSGLASAAERLGIRPENILAVGDNFNDIDMLKYAGRAVVMANAPKPLHHMGFEITEDRDHDGAAKAIERFVLENDLR